MKRYEVMPLAQTYALGVQTLRDSYAAGECPSQPTVMIEDKRWVRPLTLKENLQARVDDFETRRDENGKKRSLQDRLRLFDICLDSCSGIVYEKGTTRFKIIPACRELITIDPRFDERVILVNYDDVHGDNSITLDSNDGIYNKWLTREQVMNHPAWRAVVDDDEDGRKLLDGYSGIVFNNINNGSGFYVLRQPEYNELQALFILGGYGTGGCATRSFRNNGSFLQVSSWRTLGERGRLSLCGSAGELSLIEEEGTLTLIK